MRPGPLVLAVAYGLLGSWQASGSQRYGAWFFVSRSGGPLISADVEGIPPGHAAWGSARGRSLIIHCDQGHATGTLHASTLEGIEPLSSGAAMNSARVGVSFDAQPMAFGIWRREFDSVFPPVDFFERLARSREALVEVAVSCKGCGAPARVRLQVPTDGFADAWAALQAACSAAEPRPAGAGQDSSPIAD